MRPLDGKVAIVTGASRGIGRATAIALADAGASVVVGARDKAGLEATVAAIAAEGRRAVAVPGDVGDPATAPRLRDAALDTFGACDILINAAALGGPVGEVETFDVGEWNDLFRVNVTGTFLTCRAVVPEMKRRRTGRVMNVASGLATRVQPGQAAYSATKAAVVQFSKVLAAELDEYGIRVNAVHPGIVRTEMLARLGSVGGSAVLDLISRRIDELRAAGSVIEPEQSARLFVWLATACEWTGEFIRMDDPAVRAEAGCG